MNLFIVQLVCSFFLDLGVPWKMPFSSPWGSGYLRLASCQSDMHNDEPSVCYSRSRITLIAPIWQHAKWYLNLLVGAQRFRLCLLFSVS